MQTLAQGWLVYTMTGSAFLLGVDGFLATGPMLLFSLFGGVIADRVERRKIMLLSQCLQMTFAFVLTGLIYFHAVKVWHIFILSFLTGSAQSFSGPAYASLLPLLVKREDVPNAVAMNSMQFNLARVIGPALGGVVFGLWGATACFGLNGLSFVAVIIAVSIIKMPPLHADATSTSMMAQLKEGFAFVASRRSLLLLTFLAFRRHVPRHAALHDDAGRRQEHLQPRAAGSRSCRPTTAIGSVVGALFVAGSSYAAKKGRLALVLQLVFACTLVAFGISRHLAASLVIAFLAGACHRRRDLALQLARAAHRRATPCAAASCRSSCSPSAAACRSATSWPALWRSAGRSHRAGGERHRAGGGGAGVHLLREDLDAGLRPRGREV